VTRVLRLVRTAEFKRKQAAPGLKVTDRAFGTGWRMPIAARLPGEGAGPTVDLDSPVGAVRAIE
jgi:hypothetical protein